MQQPRRSSSVNSVTTGWQTKRKVRHDHRYCMEAVRLYKLLQTRGVVRIIHANRFYLVVKQKNEVIIGPAGSKAMGYYC